MTKRINLKNINYSQEINELMIHVPMLLMRKSAAKLAQFVNMFPERKNGVQLIMEWKYKFSQCRPEVINIIVTMAKNPSRFETTDLYGGGIAINILDKDNSTRFQMYNYTGSNNTYLPQIIINGESFLTDVESNVLGSVILSLLHMSRNENKLQAELIRLEAEKSVFSLYGQK